MQFLACLSNKSPNEFIKEFQVSFNYKFAATNGKNLEVDIYSPNLLIEYKKPDSDELKAQLKGEEILLKSRGVLENYEDFENCKKGFPNRDKDGIGQIRGYWYYLRKYGKIKPNAVSILTNGKIWIIFCFRNCEEPLRGIEDNEILLAVDIEKPKHCEILKEFFREFLEKKDEVIKCNFADKYKLDGLKVILP